MASPTAAASAKSLLLSYVSALHAKNMQALSSLIDDTSLVELPFLKPTRLIGRREIMAAHSEIFETLDRMAFELSGPLEKARHAIAEGVLRVHRKSGETQSHRIGLVAETAGHVLARISLYGDARNIRPWSDRTIL